jgi:hypothetical protein
MSSAALIFTPDNSGEAPTKHDVVNVTFKALFFFIYGTTHIQNTIIMVLFFIHIATYGYNPS